MKRELFSINAAANLAERDRQTLVRALRHVEPDGRERGQARYTMATIMTALINHEVRTGSHQRRCVAPNAFGAGSARLDEMRTKFDAAVEYAKTMKPIKKRREYALSTLAVLVSDFEDAYFEHRQTLPLDAQDQFSIRGEVNVSNMIKAALEACEWSHAEGWEPFISAMPNAEGFE
jgi:hypothetical protein